MVVNVSSLPNSLVWRTDNQLEKIDVSVGAWICKNQRSFNSQTASQGWLLTYMETEKRLLPKPALRFPLGESKSR